MVTASPVPPARAEREPYAAAHTDPRGPAALPEPHAPRRSFLAADTAEEPATQGWRATLRLPPSTRERVDRAATAEVAQHWPGPRTIAVVNGKGGAGKTPTSILLAAVFARLGGAGVLGWDYNQTRATLG